MAAAITMNQPKIAGSGAAVMALVVTFALGRSPPPPFVAATPDPSAAAAGVDLHNLSPSSVKKLI